MRGASALVDFVRTRPSVHLWLVWEPVLRTDRGLPAFPVADSRVTQLWDGARRVSAAVAAHVPPRDIDEIDGATVVWDRVLVFPPGARVEEPPTFAGGNIVDAIDALRAKLAAP